MANIPIFSHLRSSPLTFTLNTKLLFRSLVLVKIKIPSDLEGNGYVNIVMLRDIDSKKIFTSPLSYSVAPFTLDKSKLEQKVDLRANLNVKPGEKVIVSSYDNFNEVDQLILK